MPRRQGRRRETEGWDMARNVGAEKMGTVPVGRLLISMSLPIMVSMMVQALYNVVDSIFVARLSENALTALTLAFPVQNILLGIATGTGVGTGALLSRALGAKQQERANRVAGNSIVLALLSSFVLMVFGFFCSEWIIALQTDDAEIIRLGTEYLEIVTVLSFGIYFGICFNRLLLATGRTGLAMVVQLIGAITNIILDPIMIFGLFGCPAMGVAGAAYATVIGQFLSMIVTIILNFRLNDDVKLHLGCLRPSASIIRDIYRIGLPSVLMIAIGSIMTFSMNKILHAFSSTAVAVFGAYFKLQSFVVMPILGLNNGMIPIIAYNYGARRKDRILGTYRYAVLLAVGCMLAAFALFLLAPQFLLGFFTPSDAMLAIGVPALRIMASSFLFAGFCIVSGGLFQALGRSMYSLFMSMARQLVVLIPVAYLLSLTGRVELVWFSFPAAELMAVTVSLTALRRILGLLKKELAEETVQEAMDEQIESVLESAETVAQMEEELKQRAGEAIEP